MTKRNYVKARRREMEMTQLDLYTATGIWASRLSDIERGYRVPSEKEMDIIVEALKTTKEALFPRGRT